MVENLTMMVRMMVIMVAGGGDDDGNDDEGDGRDRCVDDDAKPLG